MYDQDESAVGCCWEGHKGPVVYTMLRERAEKLVYTAKILADSVWCRSRKLDFWSIDVVLVPALRPRSSKINRAQFGGLVA